MTGANRRLIEIGWPVVVASPPTAVHETGQIPPSAPVSLTATYEVAVVEVGNGWAARRRLLRRVARCTQAVARAAEVRRRGVPEPRSSSPVAVATRVSVAVASQTRWVVSG